MQAIEHLAGHAWKHPRDYGGFSPDGDYVICARTRDSSILEESNYAVASRILGAEPFDWNRGIYQPDNFETRPAAYDFRAGHWACGWVEYLLVRKDAPEELLQRAGEIVCSLADYPVLDESDFSEREFNAACDYWQSMRLRERAELCRDCGISIFAARRDELPPDDDGRLLERLTRD